MREKVSKIAHEYAVINLFLFIYAVWIFDKRRFFRNVPHRETKWFSVWNILIL